MFDVESERPYVTVSQPIPRVWTLPAALVQLAASSFGPQMKTALRNSRSNNLHPLYAHVNVRAVFSGGWSSSEWHQNHKASLPND